MTDFNETLLEFLAEMESRCVDLSGEEMSVSLTLEERPDIIFTIIMEKKEEFEKYNLIGLH